MKLMPFGGKSPSNTVVGVAVDANGKVKTRKSWGLNTVTVADYVEIRDTDAHTTLTTECNCEDAALVSLRVGNNLGVNVAVNLYYDYASSGTDYLKDYNGNYIQFVARPGYTIITPDDIPALKYIRYLKLRMQAESIPSSGGISIIAFLKG